MISIIVEVYPMTSLLVRDLDAETKHALAVRAAQNGHSQQAEVKAILKEALGGNTRGWADMIREQAKDVGGIEIPLHERHAPRLTGIEF